MLNMMLDKQKEPRKRSLTYYSTPPPGPEPQPNLQIPPKKTNTGCMLHPTYRGGLHTVRNINRKGGAHVVDPIVQIFTRVA